VLISCFVFCVCETIQWAKFHSKCFGTFNNFFFVFLIFRVPKTLHKEQQSSLFNWRWKEQGHFTTSLSDVSNVMRSSVCWRLLSVWYWVSNPHDIKLVHNFCFLFSLHISVFTKATSESTTIFSYCLVLYWLLYKKR